MRQIIKTIQEIFRIKKSTESDEYLKGFNDCFELMKIGFEKSDRINLHWENTRLKWILYKFLDFNCVLTNQQLIKTKQLVELYDTEFIFIDKLYAEVKDNRPCMPVKNSADELDTKLQGFMLKEILFKLINHKFNLSRGQTEFISEIANSNKSGYDKIQEISDYLAKLEMENSWPDHPNTGPTKAALQTENQLLARIIKLFLTHTVSKFDKYEIQDIFDSQHETTIKLRAVISYLKKTGYDVPLGNFKLKEEEKREIENILGRQKKSDQSYQELFNYINFIVSDSERNTLKQIKKKKVRLG